MKEFKSYSDFPLWAEILLIPVMWLLMIAKILIWIPLEIIARINSTMEKYE